MLFPDEIIPNIINALAFFVVNSCPHETAIGWTYVICFDHDFLHLGMILQGLFFDELFSHELLEVTCSLRLFFLFKMELDPTHIARAARRARRTEPALIGEASSREDHRVRCFC